MKKKTLFDLVREYERHLVTETLKRNGSDKRKTADALGISVRTLDRVLLRHHLIKPSFASPLPIPIGRADDEREA
jgi:transcriptional regulator with PAS, ATPase and Fis domain